MTESLRIRENLVFDGGIRKSQNLNQVLHGTVLEPKYESISKRMICSFIQLRDISWQMDYLKKNDKTAYSIADLFTLLKMESSI